ncbi:MAG: hypothetical protein AVDCRST_MAG70-2165 [uncultured Thermomicrobiales bacterium]|uniref:Uncharacterized protein n=1 Tax=uncultured Thermomicrobiales bacterium TaxID=1645740 RepID=A0A6J4V2A9_9BACT|nr:MAG: hypothetical protein AVDCRST_MAG70-2165 [uncultured Thermomicrobiales bacterium]
MHRENSGLGVVVVKGAVAGSVGVWVMDQVGSFLYRHEDPAALRQERAARVDAKDPAHVIAGKVARTFGTEPSPEQPHSTGITISA